MQPKDLKSVYNWENRRVLIKDRMFYFPDYYEDPTFVFPGWDHPDLFGNQNPIHIEYCSGNGDWIVAKALADPESNWVAVEKQYVRARKIWSKVKNLNIPNLVIVCGEGNRFTRTYVPTGSVVQAFVNFPDPWPKLRHAKHRIVKKEFALEVERILSPSGFITLVTDDPAYSKIMIDVFRKNFQSAFDAPYFATELQGYGGNSYFENLWRSRGCTIHYHRFIKR